MTQYYRKRILKSGSILIFETSGAPWCQFSFEHLKYKFFPFPAHPLQHGSRFQTPFQFACRIICTLTFILLLYTKVLLIFCCVQELFFPYIKHVKSTSRFYKPRHQSGQGYARTVTCCMGPCRSSPRCSSLHLCQHPHIMCPPHCTMSILQGVSRSPKPFDHGLPQPYSQGQETEIRKGRGSLETQAAAAQTVHCRLTL